MVKIFQVTLHPEVNPKEFAESLGSDDIIVGSMGLDDTVYLFPDQDRALELDGYVNEVLTTHPAVKSAEVRDVILHERRDESLVEATIE